MPRVYEIDPLADVRWADFLKKHASATVFHSPEWLRALQETYGFKSVVFTTSMPGQSLRNGVVFCRVQSWVTGSRLVSVPFSDHCAPLVGSEDDFNLLMAYLKEACDREGDGYVEIRSAVGAGVPAGMAHSGTFCLHRLDLRPSIKDLFHGLHESCIRRKILRAQRAGMTYEEGTSEELLEKFYHLTVLTRRRHQVLPQPMSWFRNVMVSLGDKAKIRLASHGGRAAACILTIRYKDTMTYKYGCSDPQFHRLGPMQLLMWNTIQEAKESGLQEFDMGRTDWDNPGLLNFKDRWGCVRSTLTYLRYLAPKPGQGNRQISFRVPKLIFAFSPDSLLANAGRLLYRHIG